MYAYECTYLTISRNIKRGRKASSLNISALSWSYWKGLLPCLPNREASPLITALPRLKAAHAATKTMGPNTINTLKSICLYRLTRKIDFSTHYDSKSES